MSSHYPYYPYPYHAGSQPNPTPAGAAPQFGYAQAGGMANPAGYGQHQASAYPGYYAPQPAYAARTSSSFFNFTNDRFLKGLLIGAAATYLVTNEDVQRTLIKGAVKTWSMLQGGIEEIKERFHDAEAELHHDAAQNDG